MLKKAKCQNGLEGMTVFQLDKCAFCIFPSTSLLENENVKQQ